MRRARPLAKSSIPRRAGGRANEAGMAFQAAVGTWFAVHILVRLPVGGRAGINNQALPIAIRLETGETLDDIEVSQSDGGALHIQSKTTANLGAAAGTPLAKTIGQLARWVADEKTADRLPDPTRNVALLAVRSDAPRTLDTLEAGCRAYDLGGEWSATRQHRNQAESEALGIFEAHAVPAWTAHRGTAPNENDLADLARIFRIVRFSMDAGDSDWREASRLLGRHLFGNDGAGDAALRDLKEIVRDLIRSGAPADRNGLLRALRGLGHNDIGAPQFEEDVVRLREVTADELERLAIHGRLPLGPGVPIVRESDTPLIEAIRRGSILVIGEPGAGKTGALVHAAETIAAAGETIVFLSVDRFPGVSIAAELASELGLSHSLVETLSAVPGSGRKMLFIDALDAARGGPSEEVFASIIEHVRKRLSDWIVVASIRTFDLKNGSRFRQAFAGTPAYLDHAESGLSAVSHFLVPRLSDTDLAAAGQASPRLDKLLNSAPPQLKELLHNIFNLSLAAQLLTDGAQPAAFGEIRTQAELIDAYEDKRLNSTSLQQAAAATAASMVDRRRLTVRKIVIGHPALDAVIQAGVLAEAGDMVSFSHHVLFDHVTGRFHLEWDDPRALLAQLTGDASTALLLAPALRFAVERLWRHDQQKRALSWQLLTSIFSANNVDPVIGNVALRIAVENIENEDDVTELVARVIKSPAEPSLVALLTRLARFAAMNIESTRSARPAQATTWAKLAKVLVETGERALIDPARALLQALFDHGNLSDPDLCNAFGSAARALLELAWATTPPLTSVSVSAIRYVGRVFGSDPTASHALLDQILQEPHFSQYADREANWLAEQIQHIAMADPEFAIDIYSSLYGKTITDSATSWLGGQPSRILPLSSNRKQDYEFCRWHLGCAMGSILAISPDHGTRALIEALIGKSQTRHLPSQNKTIQINIRGVATELRGNIIEFNAWDQDDENSRVREDDLLHHYVQFLRTCSPSEFTLSVTAASRDYTTASVWARIFGVGSERIDVVGDLLWPIATHPDFFDNPNTRRDTVRFCARAWPSRERRAKLHFEGMVLEKTRSANDDERQQWRRIFGRLIALLPEDSFEEEAMRVLRQDLNAEGSLIDNEPTSRLSMSWGGTGDVLLNELNRAGVNIESGINREMLDASTALRTLTEQTNSDSTASELEILWRGAMNLLALIDSNSGLPDTLEHSVWGRIAHAIEIVTSSTSYIPGEAGLPKLSYLFPILKRLSSSRYPESGGNE